MTTTATTTARVDFYWHSSTGKLGNADERPIKVGRWQRMKRHPLHGLTPVLCSAGMHASRRALDAVASRRGPIVSLCELRGDVSHDTDKSVGRWRRVIAQADAAVVLHRFAVWCAARALRQAGVTNPQIWDALRVKSRWIVGRATDGELADALATARYAARETALDAPQRAVWDAAWYAPMGAAWCAAWFAAQGAAQKASLESALDEAAAAAAAVWNELNVELERRLLRLLLEQ